MTWDQIELFATAAAKRAKTAQLMQANLAALGTAVGFSGDHGPLKRLAQSLEVGGESSSVRNAPDPDRMRDMRAAIGAFAETDMVRIKQHGTNSRRAERPARSVNKRVPRAAG